jgi:type IV secretion system protein VirB9
MKGLVALTMTLCMLSTPAAAQPTSVSNLHDSRLQLIVCKPNTPLRVIAFPDANITLVFDLSERVKRVIVSDSNVVHAAVSADAGAIILSPMGPDIAASLVVTTNIREYRFDLETGGSPAAAVLARIVSETTETEFSGRAEQNTRAWDYKLSGDKIVQPAKVSDDGTKTFIGWYPNQVLPAVFGIGPTGEEEIVAGYMRNDLFVIDRVYPRLVFRIDDARAVAKRLPKKS